MLQCSLDIGAAATLRYGTESHGYHMTYGSPNTKCLLHHDFICGNRQC